MAVVHAPARLGRYELLARLATGGMGEIFLARLEGAAGFEKLYVVKRILPHLADDARFRAMLIAEARIASRLAHANICQVYELGETDGQLYIVMEYLEGTTVLPMLRKASKHNEPLDIGLVGAVIQQAAEALHYAHELKERNGEALGIVHRDVTPSNIFLTEVGVAKVLDFGIAKVKDASAHTQTGTVKGKYAYMAPEQLRGATIDRRADVFALAVVTFEMFALRRLFQRKTDYLTFRAVMEQPIPDVRKYRPDLPDPIALALNKALDRDPVNRFETVRQFATALIDGIGTGQRPWTQAELGDFVRSNFEQEIARRSDQVSTAIHRTKPSGIGRTTMPLIQPPEPEIEIEDDDEFPPVETTINEAPVPARSMSGGRASDFREGATTPPPFAGETSTSGAQLHSITHTSATAHKRSLFWPILAMLMVGITGVALYLVWNRETIIIDRDRRGSSRADLPNGGEVPDASERATGSNSGEVVKGPDKETVAPPKPVRSDDRRYNTVLQQAQPRIAECAKKHGMPANNSKVTLNIDTVGKVFGIVPSTTFTSCMKAAVMSLQFPVDLTPVDFPVFFRVDSK